MANEITAAVRLNVSKNGATVTGDNTQTITMTGVTMIGNVQAIATTATAINLGSVTNPPAMVMFTNLDGTNFVTVDAASTMDKWPQKILPGRSILIAPTSLTIYALADTAVVDLNVVACAQ